MTKELLTKVKSRFWLALTCMLMVAQASVVSAQTELKATFNFNVSPCGGRAADPAVQASQNTTVKTFVIDEVTVATSGKTAYWGGNPPDLRFYSGSGMTVSVPENYQITNIAFAGTTAFSTTTGTYSSGKWTGNATSVDFSSTSSSSIKLNTLTVTYVLVGEPPVTVEVPIISGTEEFSKQTTVTITSAEGTTIAYTKDGTDPTTSSTAVMSETNSVSFTLTETALVKAVAMDAEANFSKVVEKQFTNNYAVIAPEISGTQLFMDQTTVSISSAAGTVIIYTTDGTDPTSSETAVTTESNSVSFTLTETATVQAVAMDEEATLSTVATKQFTKGEFVVFKKVMAADELVAGRRYLIVAGDKAATSVSGSSMNTEVVTVAADNTIAVEPANFAYTLEEATGGYKIKTPAGTYLSVTSGATSVTTSTSESAAPVFSITIDSSTGNATISGTSATSRLILYATSYNYFRNYATSNATGSGYVMPALYAEVVAEPQEVVQTISSAGYSTLYYGDINLVVPANVEAYTYKVVGEQLEPSYVYEADEVIPAGTAVVLKAEAGEYTFVATSEEGLVDDENVLLGTDTDKQLDEDASVYYYGLSRNADKTAVGFYWHAEEGGAFLVPAHKAYLKLDRSAFSSPVKGFAFDSEATGIQQVGIEAGKTASKAIYNLQGQRVDASYKGIIIMNGKKYYNR